MMAYGVHNEAYKNKCNYSIVMKKIMKYSIVAFYLGKESTDQFTQRFETNISQ